MNKLIFLSKLFTILASREERRTMLFSKEESMGLKIKAMEFVIYFLKVQRPRVEGSSLHI